ncbi:MAG: hypothetical protein QM641_05250 [Microbacterium sp.]
MTLPGCRITGIAAGLHLVVELAESVDDAALADRAKAVGIAVQPLSALRHAAGAPGLVIGYGPHPPARTPNITSVIAMNTSASTTIRDTAPSEAGFTNIGKNTKNKIVSFGFSRFTSTALPITRHTVDAPASVSGASTQNSKLTPSA